MSKAALVTGETRGIGRAIAAGLVMRGVDVLITARDPVFGAHATASAGRVWVAADVAAPACPAQLDGFAYDIHVYKRGRAPRMRNASASRRGFDLHVGVDRSFAPADLGSCASRGDAPIRPDRQTAMRLGRFCRGIGGAERQWSRQDRAQRTGIGVVARVASLGQERRLVLRVVSQGRDLAEERPIWRVLRTAGADFMVTHGETQSAVQGSKTSIWQKLPGAQS